VQTVLNEFTLAIKHIEKSEPSTQTPFKPSEHAQPEARANPLGPFSAPSCSTNTLGGRGGGIEGEKRETGMYFTEEHG